MFAALDTAATWELWVEDEKKMIKTRNGRREECDDGGCKEKGRYEVNVEGNIKVD